MNAYVFPLNLKNNAWIHESFNYVAVHVTDSDWGMNAVNNR